MIRQPWNVGGILLLDERWQWRALQLEIDPDADPQQPPYPMPLMVNGAAIIAAASGSPFVGLGGENTSSAPFGD
jgi:hypothetical protein